MNIKIPHIVFFFLTLLVLGIVTARNGIFGQTTLQDILYSLQVKDKNPFAEESQAYIGPNGKRIIPYLTPKYEVGGIPKFHYYDELSANDITGDIAPNNTLTNTSISIDKAQFARNVLNKTYVYKTSYEDRSAEFSYPISELSEGVLKKVAEQISPHIQLKVLQPHDIINQREVVLTERNYQDLQLNLPNLFVFVDGIIVLIPGQLYPQYSAGAMWPDGSNWNVRYDMGLYPMDEPIEVATISYEKFISNLNQRKIAMMWRDQGGTFDAYKFIKLEEDDSVVFDEVNPIYLAQTHALIPGFLVCGKVTYQEESHIPRASKVCGIMEAVDYGDY